MYVRLELIFISVMGITWNTPLRFIKMFWGYMESIRYTPSTTVKLTSCWKNPGHDILHWRCNLYGIKISRHLFSQSFSHPTLARDRVDEMFRKPGVTLTLGSTPQDMWEQSPRHWKSPSGERFNPHHFEFIWGNLKIYCIFYHFPTLKWCSLWNPSNFSTWGLIQ